MEAEGGERAGEVRDCTREHVLCGECVYDDLRTAFRPDSSRPLGGVGLDKPLQERELGWAGKRRGRVEVLREGVARSKRESCQVALSSRSQSENGKKKIEHVSMQKGAKK